MRRIILGVLIVSLFLLGGGIYLLYDRLKVSVNVSSPTVALSLKSKLKVEIKPNIRIPFGVLEIYITQNGKRAEIYKGPITEFTETYIFQPLEANFTDGTAKVVALLKLPLKEEKIFEKTFVVDLTPPQLSVLEKPRYLKVGEPGVLTVKSSEELKEAYIRFGNATFPLLEVGNNVYKTTFTVPLFALETPESFYIEAQDLAGNKVEKFVPVPVRLVKFRKVKITLSKETLQKIVLKYFNKPENLVEQFKTINEFYRKEDEKRIWEIGKTSSAELYAKDRFLQLPGSAVTARYGDHRFYYYNGKLISESFHKGLDLAKYRHAPVVAANNGKVIFVGHLKIYGNVVIIDHGFGVETLYGHLNDFTVKEGNFVKKGQVIGHTDTTGLALGDHLHFGVLIWGYAANPIYFFDGRYLKYHFYKFFKKTSP